MPHCLNKTRQLQGRPSTSATTPGAYILSNIQTHFHTNSPTTLNRLRPATSSTKFHSSHCALNADAQTSDVTVEKEFLTFQKAHCAITILRNHNLYRQTGYALSKAVQFYKHVSWDKWLC